MAFEQRARYRKERRKGYSGENFTKPHSFFFGRGMALTHFLAWEGTEQQVWALRQPCALLGILYGENELHAVAKCIGETAGGLSIEKGVWSSADFLMFLEFYFSFFSYEVAGPWGFTTSRSTLSLNQLKPTDILIILNLVVCRGVIHDCCVTQLSSTGLLTNHWTDFWDSREF